MLGPVGALTRKLVNADAGGVLRMFEDMGRDAIFDLVGGAGSPLGIAVNAYLKHANLTGKESARDAAREAAQEARDAKPPSAAKKLKSKISHQAWLRDNRWRFDWRSQPRRPAGTDAGGEWMEGRLEYQAETKKAFSRSVMRRRTRSMRQYKQRMKAMGNNTTRTIRSAWGDF